MDGMRNYLDTSLGSRWQLGMRMRQVNFVALVITVRKRQPITRDRVQRHVVPEVDVVLDDALVVKVRGSPVVPFKSLLLQHLAFVHIEEGDRNLFLVSNVNDRLHVVRTVRRDARYCRA